MLPKKKRPLPKEFLEELAAQQPPCPKQSKTVTYPTTTDAVVVSTPATVTSQSWSTSTTVTTVCSSIGTTHNRDSNPKVVVQLTQSLDYSFPLTCTQILLHHHSVYDKLSRRALA
jgi:hypothetical protein